MSLPRDVNPNDLPAPPSPDVTPPPPPATGWMHRSDDGEQMRAVHDAAMARRHAARTGATFVPRPPPQQPPTGWMPHPADDGGQVARMHADRQSRSNPTILGRPVAFRSSSP